MSTLVEMREPDTAPHPSGGDVPAILEVIGVTKHFRRRGGEAFKAVNSASLTVRRGETVALVGESGSGKSTFSRIALGLLRPDEGRVLLLGESIYDLSPDRLRLSRTTIQPVFQDASTAFNPRRTVQESLAQACWQRRLSGGALRQRVVELLDQVQLTPGESFLSRFPHELSGGQRQRLGIARAIAMDPMLIFADEPLSGADVSIRAQVLKLLRQLREERHGAYLFVTHDIALARGFADRVAVMFQGSIVEQGPAREVIDNPKNAYTKRLVAGSLRPKEAMRQVGAGEDDHAHRNGNAPSLGRRS